MVIGPFPLWSRALCWGWWCLPPLLVPASSLLVAGAGRWPCLRRSMAGFGSLSGGVSLVSLLLRHLISLSWVVRLMGSLVASHNPLLQPQRLPRRRRRRRRGRWWLRVT